MDDQVNIKFLNVKGEINTLKDMILDCQMKMKDCKMEMNNQKARIKCLEDCEDLRDQQMNVLKNFIETYLSVHIDEIKGDHDGKIGVLQIPKAKK